MKKFYIFAVAAGFAANSLTAATPMLEPTQGVSCPLEKISSTRAKRTASHNNANGTKQNRIANSISAQEALGNPALNSHKGRRAVSEEEWNYLGETTFTDPFLFTAYNIDYSGTTTVNAYQNKSDANKYLFTDLYPQSMIDLFPAAHYRRLDPDGESTVIMTVNPENKEVVADFSFNITDGDIISTGQYRYGLFTNDTFWFNEECFLVFYDDKAYNYSRAFDIKLPGARDLRLDLEAVSPVCTDDNKIIFSVDGGADATIKVYLTKGIYRASADNLSVVAAQGQEAAPGTYAMQCSDGWHTLFAVSTASDGTVANGLVLYHYGLRHDDSEWRNLGTWNFTDDTFAPVYSIFDAFDPYGVTVLEKATNPNVIRLVSPYDGHPLSTSIDIHDNHDHFMTFDLSSPGAVTVDFAPMGVDTGNPYCWSIDCVDEGTLADGTLTFPKNGLVVYDRQLRAYYANRSGRFAVEVPDHLTVTVSDESGEPIEGVAVKALGSEAEGVLTDADGVAHLGAPAGTTEFSLEKEGYKPLEFTVEANGRQLTAAPVMELQNTGVESMTISKADFRNAYDLAGRRIQHPANGIMIINGKKTIK